MGLSYIEELRQEFKVLEDSGKEFGEELSYFPDLIQILFDLMDETTVDRKARVMINIALGYLLIPNDVIPEEKYGVYGYMDDLYVTCVILTNLKVRYNDLMNKHWDNSESLNEVLIKCTSKSDAFLKEMGLKETLLRYAGLTD